MPLIPRLSSLWRNLFLKARKEQELTEEIDGYLEMLIESKINEGLDPAEARRAALIELGGKEQVKEKVREVSAGHQLETLWQDLRYALRMLRRNPGFASVAVLTLALGIGANTAIFSVVNTLLFRSLPVKDPNELVLLAYVNGAGAYNNFSYRSYEQLRESGRSLSGIFAAFEVSKQRMKVDGSETESIRVQAVTGNFFSVLGVPPMLGRTFTTDDDQVGRPQVGVISHSFWQRRFGADPAVVGKTITFEDAPLTIVGVAPPGFFGFEPGEHPDLWGPAQALETQWIKDLLAYVGRSWSWSLNLMGRLSAGVTRVQAQAEIDQIFQRHLSELRASSESMVDRMEREGFFNRKIELQPGAAGYTDLRQQFRRSLLLLMTAAGMVLLIACANVASLQLARAAARRHEFTLRSALGAGRPRLVRQLLTESLLLAALGGLFGLLLAQWGTRALLLFMRLEADPISFSVAPDTRVLLFTLAASLLTGLLFGVAPALRGSRFDLASELKGAGGSVAGGASRQRLNQALVVAQVALTLTMLIGASLFLRTLQKLNATDAGFNREKVVLFDLDLDFNQHQTRRRATLYKELLARLETLPGVSAAGMSSSYVLGGKFGSTSISAEDYAARPDKNLMCDELWISSRFFETTGTPLVSGRGFGPQDEIHSGSSGARAPETAVINQAMARRYFGDANPIGRRFYNIGDPKAMALKVEYEIVGVVKDVRFRSLRNPSTPAYYMPFFRHPGDDGIEMTFVARTTSDAGALTSSLRRIVREVDPAIQARNVRSLNDVVNTSLHQERVLAQLGPAISLFALALACLGLYGVLSFAVVQRTREIGVRIALGAQRKDVLSLVVGQGLKLALLGLALGLGAAFAVTRFVESLLYGVTATDPVSFVGVSLLLLLVAVLASWLPARRATKVDPMVALRDE